MRLAKGSSGFDKGGGSDIPKPGDEVYIKDWFKNKIELPNYAMTPSRATIIEERGKAWKVSIETETLDGERDLYYERYIPKSVVETKKQRKAAEREEERRYEKGVQKYNAMIEFAKEHGIKGVRVGLRKETILKKIKDAGYKYKY